MVSENDVLEFAMQLGEEVACEEREMRDDKMHAEPCKIFRRGEKVFLVLWKGTQPLRIEVRCDGKLGKLLREKYESVMLSKSLGGSGVEVICAGQMSQEDVLDLVRLGWELCA